MQNQNHICEGRFFFFQVLSPSSSLFLPAYDNVPPTHIKAAKMFNEVFSMKDPGYLPHVLLKRLAQGTRISGPTLPAARELR
jgi:hypothetical protein